MSTEHYFLKNFDLQSFLNPENTTILCERNDNGDIIHLELPVKDKKTMLKTSDLKIVSTSKCNTRFIVSIEDVQDLNAIKKMDSQVRSLLGANLKTILQDDNYDDDEDIKVLYTSSLNDNLFTLTSSSLNSFNTYDPNRCIISGKRLKTNVIFRAALKPWNIDYCQRLKRFKICWTISQAMIVDEPSDGECVLDAETK
jgi:hypothetical protein